MNLKLFNPTGFASEYQCDPEKPSGVVDAKEFVPAAIAQRLNGLPQYTVPADCSRVTAFVDCGGELLWYAVVAWSERFGGAIVDYGTWPRQSRSVFARNDPKPGLSQVYPSYTEEQRVYAALSSLMPEVLGRSYKRADGTELRVDRCLIDSGWKPKPVYDYCVASPYSQILYPSKGFSRSDTQAGVARWKQRPGERSGYHWRLTVSEQKLGRSVQFDPDAWKTFVWGALSVPLGGGTALTLWGNKPGTHEMIAEHFASETSAPKKTKYGDTFDKWSQLDNRDNDWLDCVVGCAVAASVQGLQIITGEAPPVNKPKPVVKLSELMRRKTGGA